MCTCRFTFTFETPATPWPKDLWSHNYHHVLYLKQWSLSLLPCLTNLIHSKALMKFNRAPKIRVTKLVSDQMWNVVTISASFPQLQTYIMCCRIFWQSSWSSFSFEFGRLNVITPVYVFFNRYRHVFEVTWTQTKNENCSTFCPCEYLCWIRRNSPKIRYTFLFVCFFLFCICRHVLIAEDTQKREQ